MWDCAWPAPAKLNLFLHVTGLRADGLHELQTLFQFVDFGDTLSFRVRDDGVIHRYFDHPEVAADADLVVRAARRLKAEAGPDAGADIALTKRIPHGGGLGGGSSDAATVLIALNRLWRVHLGPARLAEIGLELGADVPVFIHGHAAWAEGIGERLSPAHPAEPWYLVVAPPVRVSTAEVFAAAELTRDTPPITIRDFLAGEGGNVCEPVVRARYPVVGDALDWLRERGVAARLSGTGACVFGALGSEAEARAMWALLPAEWAGFVAHGLNESTLITHTRIRDAA